MKYFYILIALAVSANVNALQLRNDSDFDWVAGCEIVGEDIDYNLVYEDMVKKQYPVKYEQLILDRDAKRRTFEDLDRAKKSGYLCTPIAIIKFDIKMGAYDLDIPGFMLSQHNIPKSISVENSYFRNLPNPYQIELFEFSIPDIVKIDNRKAYRMLQRCPEIQNDSFALLEVNFVFRRKDAGHYIGFPRVGRISANCELMPDKLLELMSFEYKQIE